VTSVRRDARITPAEKRGLALLIGYCQKGEKTDGWTPAKGFGFRRRRRD